MLGHGIAQPRSLCGSPPPCRHIWSDSTWVFDATESPLLSVFTSAVFRYPLAGRTWRPFGGQRVSAGAIDGNLDGESFQIRAWPPFHLCLLISSTTVDLVITILAGAIAQALVTADSGRCMLRLLPRARAASPITCVMVWYADIGSLLGHWLMTAEGGLITTISLRSRCGTGLLHCRKKRAKPAAISPRVALITTRRRTPGRVCSCTWAS